MPDIRLNYGHARPHATAPRFGGAYQFFVRRCGNVSPLPGKALSTPEHLQTLQTLLGIHATLREGVDVARPLPGSNDAPRLLTLSIDQRVVGLTGAHVHLFLRRAHRALCQQLGLNDTTPLYTLQAACGRISHDHFFEPLLTAWTGLLAAEGLTPEPIRVDWILSGDEMGRATTQTPK